MDGLEDRAEASLQVLLEDMHSKEYLEIKHSSRDTVMHFVNDELIKAAEGNAPPITTKKIVLRSGISLASLMRLHQTLQLHSTIETLEFVSLRGLEQLQAAITCCRLAPSIRVLSLKNYHPISRHDARFSREDIARTIGENVFGFGDNATPMDPMGCIATLETLEMVNIPIGSEGGQVFAEFVARNKTLKTLKIVDCDLRSNSLVPIALMIRQNQTLSRLDLSHNRLLLGGGITMDMSLKTLLRKGLQYNLNLLELCMDGIDYNNKKIARQMHVSRMRRTYIETVVDPYSVPPSVWPLVMGQASAKPSALFLFLRDSAAALFY